MSSTITTRLDESSEQPGSSGVERSRPGGRRSDALVLSRLRYCHPYCRSCVTR